MELCCCTITLITKSQGAICGKQQWLWTLPSSIIIRVCGYSQTWLNVSHREYCLPLQEQYASAASAVHSQLGHKCSCHCDYLSACLCRDTLGYLFSLFECSMYNPQVLHVHVYWLRWIKLMSKWAHQDIELYEAKVTLTNYMLSNISVWKLTFYTVL